MNNIPWVDLGLIVLIIVGIAVCIYLIVLIRQINSSVSIIKDLLEENKDNIDRTLKDMPVITKNLVEVTETAKGELKVMEAAIGNISETVEMTAATVNTFKKDFLGKIKMIIDFIDIAKRILPRKK